MATPSENPDDLPKYPKNFHITEQYRPQIFHPFTNFPTEIRLKIFNLVARIPRIIHFDHVGAIRSKLTLDRQVPPLLHVCRESRKETISLYELVYLQLGHRKLFVNPNLDILLWIPYPGPRTFKNDVENIVEGGSFPRFSDLAISQKFWNRIITDPGPVPLHGSGTQDILYHMIRKHVAEGKLGKVTILNISLKWEGTKGCRVEIVRRRMSLRVKGRPEKRVIGKEEAWWRWDGIVEDRVEEYERDFGGAELAEVEKGRVIFVKR